MNSFKNKWYNWLVIDSRSLRLFRVAFGLILLVDLLIKFNDIPAFYSDVGIVSNTFLSSALPSWFFGIFQFCGDPDVVRLLFGFQAVLLIGFILGWGLPTVTVILYVFNFSLVNRMPYAMNGANFLITNLLFIFSFLPLSERLSISKENRSWPGPCFSWWNVALFIQIVIIYLFPIVTRTDASWWQNFTAVSLIAQNEIYTTKLLGLLVSLPLGAQALTLLSLLCELSIVLLLFFGFMLPEQERTKLILACLIFVLHFSILVLMDIGLFPYLGLAISLIFIPSCIWGGIDKAHAGNLFGPVNLIKEKLGLVCAVLLS